jgi:hypothetical protein
MQVSDIVKTSQVITQSSLSFLHFYLAENFLQKIKVRICEWYLLLTLSITWLSYFGTLYQLAQQQLGIPPFNGLIAFLGREI